MKGIKPLLKHPKIFCSFIFALTVFFAFQLRGVNVENTLRMFFPKQHISWQRLMDTEEQFGSMVAMGVAFETQKEAITSDLVAAITKITSRIEDLEFVEDVDSISNIDFVYEKDGALVAEDLVNDDYTGTKEDIQDLKHKINSWGDMYDRVIKSDDSKALQIAISLAPKANTKQTTATLSDVKKIVQEETKDLDVTPIYFGDPVISDNMKAMMSKDLIFLIPLVAIVVLASLFLSFGTIDGTVLPLITVLISSVWSCGIMAMLKVTFTLVSTVIPVALIAVGSAYGIHVLTHYYIMLDTVEGELTKQKHIDVILLALEDVKNAVILAGLTTVVGFVSLVTSPIGPLHSFAIFTGLGVFFALFLSVTLLPCMLSLKKLSKVGIKSKALETFTTRLKEKMQKLKARQVQKSSQQRGLALTLMTQYKILAGTKPRLIVFCIFMIILSVVGIKKLVVDTSLVSYFPESTQFRKDLHYIDENFAGSNGLFFLVSGQNKSDMCNPEILKAMDDMQDYLVKRHNNIGKVVSFTTFLKRMNQVMHVPKQQDQEQQEGNNTGENTQGDFSFGSFSEGSFSNDTEGQSDDFSLDSFSFDFATDTNDTQGAAKTSDIANTADTKEDYVDPLPQQATRLEETLNITDMLTMLSGAYSAAGGKNASLEDIVRAIEKYFNYNGTSYYEVPYDPNKYPATTREQLSDLVSQYLLLFSGSLDKFNDDPLCPRVCRMQLQLRTHSTKDTNVIIADALDFAKKHFPQGYTLEATGNGEMECVMTELVVKSQIMSLVFSMISVFVILSFAFKSPVAGLIGTVPLLFTIFLNYMMMGLCGIRLDFLTSIIASVAVGVGIDYTIHFMTTYKDLMQKSRQQGDMAYIDNTIFATFQKSGLGIITNALAVGLGFLVLCLSNFVVLRYVGILVAIVMFTSSLLALTLIPAILRITKPKFLM